LPQVLTVLNISAITLQESLTEMADVIAMEMIKLRQPVGALHMATSNTRAWDGSWLLKCGRRM
jgi:hypothetical protein